MKQTKLFTVLFLATVVLFAQEPEPSTLFFRFNNDAYINSNTQFQFDVEIKSDTDSICMRDIQIYFDYNPGQFGYNIVNNDNIVYQFIGLMDDPGVVGNPFYPLYGVVNQADNFSTRYAVITETLYPNYSCGETFNFLGQEYPYNLYIPTEWIGLMRFTLNVENCAVPAGIEFTGNTGAFEFDTIVFDNDLLNRVCNLGLYEQYSLDIRVFANQQDEIIVTTPEGESGSVTIFNILGQKIISKEIRKSTNRFNMNGRKGYFVVRVFADNEAFTGKVLIR